jgi:CO dehydrogenase maturation factor
MFRIDLAGKGSSGKSTLVPPLVAQLKQGRRLLVVDADPHLSAAHLLGVTPRETLGTLRSSYEREFKTGQGVGDDTRDEFAEKQMGAQALCHGNGFDFLAMGRWELAGSQCTVNRVLERALESLARSYDVVLVDNEAGVEHVGRFASTPIDLLLLVATPEALSLNVAGQILAHCREVERPVRQALLLLNRVLEGDLSNEKVLRQVSALRVNLAGTIPESAAMRRGDGKDIAWEASVQQAVNTVQTMEIRLRHGEYRSRVTGGVYVV